MTASRAWFGLVAYGGYMYAIGGQNAAVAVASTEHAVINGNGTLGNWAADTSMGVGNERADFGYAQFNGYVYVAGGMNNSSAFQNTVFHSQIGAGSLGAWVTNDTTFTTVRTGATLVAYGATLYLMGGIDAAAGNYLLDTQYVNITGTGTIGTWTFGTSLPQPVRQGTGFAANGYLYVFGGRSASATCTTNTYVAPINGYPPGSSSRYGIGGWSQTVVAFSEARYGASASYNAGKTYILGGACSTLIGQASGGTTPYPNRVFYSTLQSQPQISNYSVAIDQDTDVFPAKYLMNGVDNGTGAQWQLSYKSSNNATNAWSAATNAGVVTLGTPGAVSYADTLTGERWYFLSVTVDASQAFGYPEDVTRGPTITDITLETTVDPGKRLHHGKSFTGGVLQPLDAPF